MDQNHRPVALVDVEEWMISCPLLPNGEMCCVTEEVLTRVLNIQKWLTRTKFIEKSSSLGVPVEKNMLSGGFDAEEMKMIRQRSFDQFQTKRICSARSSDSINVDEMIRLGSRF